MKTINIKNDVDKETAYMLSKNPRITNKLNQKMRRYTKRS